MLSRDPRDYHITIQSNIFRVYDDDGLVESYESESYKTFTLKAIDGSFERVFSVESAPNWVMQIYNKLVK